MERIRNFMAEESGAVTADWVVLTAAVVGLALVMIINVGSGVTAASQGISSNVNSITPGYMANAG